MKRKKLLRNVLLLAAVLSMMFVAVPVFAQKLEAKPVGSLNISQGSGNIYVYYDSSNIYVEYWTGNGKVKDFTQSSVPWIKEGVSRRGLKVSEAITYLGDYFVPYSTEWVYIPGSVTSVSSKVFANARNGLSVVFEGSASKWNSVFKSATGVSSAGSSKIKVTCLDQGTLSFSLAKETSYTQDKAKALKRTLEKMAEDNIYNLSINTGYINNATWRYWNLDIDTDGTYDVCALFNADYTYVRCYLLASSSVESWRDLYWTYTRDFLGRESLFWNKETFYSQVSFSFGDYQTVSMTLSASSFVYTGSEIKPTVTVKGSKGSTLTQGTDYKVTYENNINVGTATVTVTPVRSRGYIGTRTQTFKITPASVTNLGVKNFYNYTYDGTPKTQNSLQLSYKGKVLTKGKDYTLTFKDNVNAGTAWMYINGKGNFKGSSNKTKFTIYERDLSNATVNVSDGYYYDNNNRGGVRSVVLNGKTLTNSIDYTVTTSHGYEKVGTVNYTVTGINNYKGKITGTYQIKPYSLTNRAVVKFAKSTYDYTGYQIKPEPTVYVGQAVIPKSEYTVSYSNNVKSGTATCTITGKGNYTGSASGTFTIAPKAVSITLSRDSFATWNLSALTSVISGTVKMNDGTTRKVTNWKSSVTSVATISSGGVITPKKAGVTTITGTYGSLSKSITLTVRQRVELKSFTLNYSSYNLKVGQSFTLKVASTTPSNASVKTVTYKSMNTSVATVTAAGVVKGVGKGTTNIEVTSLDGGYKRYCKVTVS